MRLLAVLGAGALLSGGVAACGGLQHGSTATNQALAKGHQVSPVATTDRIRPHPLFGDYDDDDYLYGYNDYDPDDHTQPKDRDGDIDARGGGRYFDRDDSSIISFGRPATPGERRAIAALAEHYYAAAARADGQRLCAMTYRPLAASYPNTIGENGPRYLHGLHTCAQIISKAFAGIPQMLPFSLRLGITDIRVSGKVGIAVLGVAPFPLRLLKVFHERGKWTLYGALDNELP